jgi:hypothetical protein
LCWLAQPSCSQVCVCLKTSFDRRKRIKRVQDQTDNPEFSGCCRAKAAVTSLPVPAFDSFSRLSGHFARSPVTSLFFFQNLQILFEEEKVKTSHWTLLYQQTIWTFCKEPCALSTGTAQQRATTR